MKDNPKSQITDFKLDESIEVDCFEVRRIDDDFVICKGKVDCVLCLCDKNLKKLVNEIFLINGIDALPMTLYLMDILSIEGTDN